MRVPWVPKKDRLNDQTIHSLFEDLWESALDLLDACGRQRLNLDAEGMAGVLRFLHEQPAPGSWLCIRERNARELRDNLFQQLEPFSAQLRGLQENR